MYIKLVLNYSKKHQFSTPYCPCFSVVWCSGSQVDKYSIWHRADHPSALLVFFLEPCNSASGHSRLTLNPSQMFSHLHLTTGTLGGPNERRLINDLTANYNKLERPVANESEAVVLKFGLTLQQIMDVVGLVNLFSFVKFSKQFSFLRKVFHHWNWLEIELLL